MIDEFDLEEYLNNGVEEIIKGAIKVSLKNPKESLFISKYTIASKAARKIRLRYEKLGVHIPPFLIASITSTCNLYCKGCYSRANQSCTDNKADHQMTDVEWRKIFKQAEELGIGFILLAGGEPLLRYDVIQAATEYKKIIFPIFTNGTMLNERYLNLLDNNRNLMPVLSLEGDKQYTDNRRGEGVYLKLISEMNVMRDKGILFGVSITVTKENIHNVLSEDFISELYHRGCKIVFFVEYVPVNEETIDLAPAETEREYMEEKLVNLRKKFDHIIFISFPGDEISSGGCLAAGRGFFHINPLGGVEPCPFSPFSDTSMKENTLLEALKSPLFMKLRESELLMQNHDGGCVLFKQEEDVKKLLNTIV